jgi:hypothetical protein
MVSSFQLTRAMRLILTHQRHGEHRGDRVDELNMITGAVIAAGVRIHRKLGPGLLESV